MRSVQPVHAVFREKQVVIALLKVMQIAHIRIQLAQKPCARRICASVIGAAKRAFCIRRYQ